MAIGSIGYVSTGSYVSALSGATQMVGGQGGQGDEDPFVTDLANKLGISASDLKTAMQAARKEVQSSKSSSSTSNSSSGSGVDAMSTALSKQLGIDATTIQNAVNELHQAHQGRGGHGGHHGGGGGGQLLNSVADSVGVSSSDLENAFASVLQSSLSNTSTSSTQDTSSLLTAVANKLGVDSSTLIDAFKNAKTKMVDSYA